MSRYKIIFYFSLSMFLCVFPAKSISDDNAGVVNEMLEPIFSQEYLFHSRAQYVWKIVSSVARNRIENLKGHILVKNQSSLTLSWVEHIGIENSHKLPTQQKILYNKELAEIGEGGIAITTISIRDRPNGSLLRIRRIYYGQFTRPKMVHSRGSFANMFQALLHKKLEIK